MVSFKNPIFKKFFVFLLITFISLFAQSQFREEMATLETMYEERARSVVNTVLRPNEYSLVVAVDIDRDESRLAKIQEEFEKDLLPGMPGGLNSENPAIANQLYELKNKIDIHLVLSNKITKEKEETISSLLKMKLHLDDKNGDTLVIARSDLPTAMAEENASKLPELSWKMWGMLSALLLLVLSGLFYYLSKKQDPKKNINPEKEPVQEKKSESNEKKQQMESPKSELPTIDPSEVMFEQKQQILSLSTKYPEATINSLNDHFQKGNEKDILLMCEAFGWELSKKIFSGFSPRVWGRMGHLVLQKKNTATIDEMSRAMENCSKVILKKFLEIGDADTKNPFGFIWKLNSYDRSKLLANESATNIALICAHGDSEQVSELMESLEPVMQEAVTISISRLQNYNDQQIKSVNDSLIRKLKVIQSNPETRANGIELVADLLRSLPAEKEQSFFEKIIFENPSDGEKIRRTMLTYSDIQFVPAEVISEMSALLELNIVVTALRKNFPAVREYILQSLPPKKSYMIARDLELSVLVSDKQIAMSQREIVKTISALLKARNIELVQLLGDSVYSLEINHQNAERIEAA